MAQGYFLCRGDRTSCGGEILEGDPIIQWHGRPAAREGDKVTCGKHGGVYQITGGVSNMTSINGKRIAGTLDSRSTCPCHAQLLSATRADTYHKQERPVEPVKNYGRRLTFQCAHKQEPLEYFVYSLQVGNQEIKGVTSNSGESKYIDTRQPEEIKVNYLIQTEVGI
ncbi:PAAR domain-containing protein [Neisseriaceae bacterium ESL0693]|nr:PAAR domain-containing protein [Neisseriaceae bacterium ESL0693]